MNVNRPAGNCRGAALGAARSGRRPRVRFECLLTAGFTKNLIPFR
jgi:hypothetical protein